MSNPQFLQALTEAWSNMIETTFPVRAMSHPSPQVVANLSNMIETTFPVRAMSHPSPQVVANFNLGQMRDQSEWNKQRFVALHVTLDNLSISALDGIGASGPTPVVGDDMVLWLSFSLLEGRGNFNSRESRREPGHFKRIGRSGRWEPERHYENTHQGTFKQTFGKNNLAFWVSMSDNKLTFKGAYIGVSIPLLLPEAGELRLTPSPPIPDSLSVKFSDGRVDDKAESVAAEGIQKMANAWAADILSGILRKKLGV